MPAPGSLRQDGDGASIAHGTDSKLRKEDLFRP